MFCAIIKSINLNKTKKCKVDRKALLQCILFHAQFSIECLFTFALAITISVLF